MPHKKQKIAFGPVPSRRLGQSLGINNIPPKICTYSCIYCQVGRTLNMQVNREEFYSVDEIVRSVENQVNEAYKRGEHIDYLTFVPDGEPTLDSNIGEEIDTLKPLGIKIAIITNGTLLWREDVREDLLKADWVSVKVDAVIPPVWRTIDRPHKSLDLDEIHKGMIRFSQIFDGYLATETMLIDGINDQNDVLTETSRFISMLHPMKSYLSIPTRPPAEKRVKSASVQAIAMAYQIFIEQGLDVEHLIGYEGNAFAFTG
ncbi:radical SAM protein, partial [bacterium]|nr:radical SAM protein [candidate division CSSED10-310 bacterium]